MSEHKQFNFCTLFDTYYLSRGLALYESLENQLSNFHLYIFAFNEQSYTILRELNLAKATIISLEEFENEALLKVKSQRSIGEYCWTCTSSTIKYCLDTFELDHCTYLDADLYFFNSPQPLFDEIGEQSVLITEHRYTPKYDQSEVSGKYCVQFMYFKNDERARACLQWWIDACIDWCFAKPEPGKFGDQKYLDDWTNRFKGIHELKHLGGGTAPWNIQQYSFHNENNKIVGIEKSNRQSFDLIFFHFHAIAFYTNGKIDLGDYVLTPSQIQQIYIPYIKHLEQIREKIEIQFGINPHGNRKPSNSLREFYRKFKRKLKGNYNLYALENLLLKYG